MVRPGESQQWY